MTVFSTALIPLLPLGAFIVILFFGKWLKEKSAWIAILASAASCAVSFQAIGQVIKGTTINQNMTWLIVNQIPLEFGITIDPLAAMMLFVVTFIGSLIIIYSVGYMHGDPRYPRFFAYLSLFMFSMLGLVLSSTLVQIYLFWELVGLCSYFLIGFWFEKKSASDAGRKAFITNRIGDIGFFLGIVTFFYATGTVRFADIHPEFIHSFVGAYGHTPLLTLSALFLFCGAVGKSAQFPLHVWLPDAMEGPTPVSALIHAATMVAAGVYLVARLFPLFQAIPEISQIVAVIGTATALMAAFFALTQMDIKKVLAYSTISQLGYMMAALGVGGMTAGAFHLMTHAFFKALLFLGAGSVIHGSGVQDMREMGGLRKSMPVTFWTFVIATVAISGIPPFAGFWSKDEILVSAFGSHRIIFWLLVFTALMTSFYMFRLLFLTFFGKTRGHHHAHESPLVMTLPLVVLAIGSAVMGLPGSPWLDHWFQNFLAHHPEEIHVNPFVVTISIATSVAGFIIAFFFYITHTNLPRRLAQKWQLTYAASQNKLWIDELYQLTFIRWFKQIAKLAFQFDAAVIDRGVNEVGFKTILVSRIKNWIDQYIVDGLVNLTGWIARSTSAFLRLVQTGYIHNYLFFLLLGVLIIAFTVFNT
ncbi:MAG: NADH-quinone oxidoreductase subunit L [Candidatus Omnitrophica bacterium]|nr:NADH-quinone oxidoreductase subunit L [Candidatus Omnitrophota bacterium]